MKIAIFGSGGHGRTVLANFLAQQDHGMTDYVFLDDSAAKVGTRVDGVPVLGDRRYLFMPDWNFDHFVIIAVGDTKVRAELFQKCKLHGGRFITSIHPAAVLCQDSMVLAGSAVMPGAIIGAGARVGENCVINNAVSVGHECVVHDHASLNDGTRLGGSAVIETEAYLGLNVSVLPRARIGARSIIGAGSVVTTNIPPGATAVGVPARVITRPMCDGPADASAA